MTEVIISFSVFYCIRLAYLWGYDRGTKAAWESECHRNQLDPNDILASGSWTKETPDTAFFA